MIIKQRKRAEVQIAVIGSEILAKVRRSGSARVVKIKPEPNTVEGSERMASKIVKSTSGAPCCHLTNGVCREDGSQPYFLTQRLPRELLLPIVTALYVNPRTQPSVTG